MAIVQISKIQVRTGSKLELPVLSPGELGYATDTKQLYIGNENATSPNHNTEIKTTDAISAPGGVDNDTQVIYNWLGVLRSDEAFTYDHTTKTLSVTGDIRGTLHATDITGQIAIANGGTGSDNRQDAINALTGTQQANTVLRSDGTNITLSPVILTSDVMDILPIANGGTGQSSFASGYIKSNGTELSSSATIPATDIVGNIPGNAVNVTGVVAIEHGGTGQSTQQAAINALVGTPSSGTVLKSTDGIDVKMAKLDLSDDVTGTLSIANGGTGASTGLAAINALLTNQDSNEGKYLTTDGSTVSWATPEKNPGTVTNIDVSGGTTGLEFTGGPVTSNGIINLTGVLSIEHGGTGKNSFTPGYIFASNNSLYSQATIPGSDVIGDILGNSSNVTGIVAIENGGTGSTNQQDALNALVGTQTANRVLRSNGTNVTLDRVNMSTDVTGVLSIENGGTGKTTGLEAINALLTNQIGNEGKVLSTNGSSVIWVSGESIEGSGGSGSVSSVGISGGTTGLTASDPITSSGYITLGGTLAIEHGGTGQNTRQKAINALAGSLVENTVLRSNGVDITLSPVILSSDVSGVLPISNGGLGLISVSRGDLIYGANPQANPNSSIYNKLSIGSETQVLKVGSTGIPEWGFVNPNIEEIIPTNGQTVLNTNVNTAARINNKISIMVFLNGILQREGESKSYVVSGENQITFKFELSDEDEVIIYSFI